MHLVAIQFTKMYYTANTILVTELNEFHMIEIGNS